MAGDYGIRPRAVARADRHGAAASIATQRESDPIAIAVKASDGEPRHLAMLRAIIRESRKVEALNDMASGVERTTTGWLSNLIGHSWMVRTPTAGALACNLGALALGVRSSTPFGWLLAFGTAQVLTAVAVLAALASDEPLPWIWGGGWTNISRRALIGGCIGQAVLGALCNLWVVLEAPLVR